MHAQHYYMHTGLVKVKVCSCVQLCVTPWTVAYQAPLSMEFSRQGYFSNCHFLLKGIITTQELNLCLLPVLYWQVDYFSLAPSVLVQIENMVSWGCQHSYINKSLL